MKDYSCKQCHKPFTSPGDLGRHYKVFTTHRPTAVVAQQLARAKKNRIKDTVDWPSAEEPRRKLASSNRKGFVFKCGKCTYKSTSATTLGIHYKENPSHRTFRLGRPLKSVSQPQRILTSLEKLDLLKIEFNQEIIQRREEIGVIQLTLASKVVELSKLEEVVSQLEVPKIIEVPKMTEVTAERKAG